MRLSKFEDVEIRLRVLEREHPLSEIAKLREKVKRQEDMIWRLASACGKSFSHRNEGYYID